MGQLGIEIVQKYPLRVIREAITNAVIHRDYRLPSDIQVRLFADRIEVESPGLLIGPVTPSNIRTIGTHSRNQIISGCLREFPNPPNLDAGEGVRMMFQTMRAANLYPPQYHTQPSLDRDSVLVTLLNHNRPSVWEEVSDYIDKNGRIANKQVRQVLRSDDTLRASKLLREWVEQGLLVVVNPEAGTRARFYAKTMMPQEKMLLSTLEGKEKDNQP